MIYAFYSYKGGVGRSMALANVGHWLSLQGLNVLIVDWDLEAPGLEEFFYDRAEDLESIRAHPGVIDLLLAYKRSYPGIKARLAPASSRATLPSSAHDGIAATVTVTDRVERLTTVLPPLDDAIVRIRVAAPGEGRGSLGLVTAGWRAGEYAHEYAAAVQAFDWSEFYAAFDGEAYFDWLRLQLTKVADVVLLDSRTGVTEMGGVCTRQLADVVVSMCAPNRQNLRGLVDMLRSFRRSALLTARGRALDLVVVPTRIENTEITLLNTFARDFSQRVDEYTPASFRRAQRTFWDLRIPYVSKYAYAESLAVGVADTAPDLENAYKTLAAHILLMAPPDLTSKAGPELARAVNGLKSTGVEEASARVVIAYTASDGLPVATIAATRLHTDTADATMCSDAEAEAALTPDRLLPGDLTAGQRRTILSVVTPGAAAATRLLTSLDDSRRRGSPIVAILGVPRDRLDVASLPLWLQAQRLFDPYGEWDAIVRAINSVQRAVKVPLMAPEIADSYIRRPLEQDALVAMLIDPTREAASTPVTLVGGPGTGKTTLAAAVCRDERVVRTFYDGILWTTLGPTPDVMRCLSELYISLTGERPAFLSIEDAAAALQDVLERKRCLIVLDDVWNEADLAHFLRGGARCVRLITSRNLNVARVWTGVNLGGLARDEAIALLLQSIGQPSADISALGLLADRLSRWPLLLYLAGTMLRERTRRGDSPGAAIGFVNKAMDRRGVTAFDKPSDDPALSLAASLERSVAQLNAQERLRCAELSAFPMDVPIPLAAVQDVWATDEVDTENLLQRLEVLSLVLLDLQGRTVSMHQFVRAWLRQTLKDIATVEERALQAMHNAALATNSSGASGGAKLALCIGINTYSTRPLAGCVNDARNWRSALEGLGFAVTSLHDREATRAAILAAARQLIDSAEPGDVIVFQFAGHGIQVDNLSGDEADAFDEAFCPIDCPEGHLIIDDEIREMFSRLAAGVNLTCFLDCCYSGTITRAPVPAGVTAARSERRARFLPYSRDLSDRHREFRSTQLPFESPPASARVPAVLFSACQHSEVAYETDSSGLFSAAAISVILSGGPMSNAAFIKRVGAAFGSDPVQHPMYEGSKAARYQGFLAPVVDGREQAI